MNETISLIQICRELLSGDVVASPEYESDPLTPQLAMDYAKHIAAKKLGGFGNTELGEAALVKAALTNDEDDRVRVEAVQQLLIIRSKHAEAVLLGLLFDSDEEMRLAAIEGLVLLRSANVSLAAEILANDKSAIVRETASRANTDKEILLYKLEPI